MITVCLHERTLPLRRALPTPQGKIHLRRVQVLVLTDGAGKAGYGEAAPLPVYGSEDPLSCSEALDTVLPELPIIAERWLEQDRPTAGLGPLERRLHATPCARACIEGALLDLWAKRAGLGLADILQRDADVPLLRSLPVAGMLIGGGEDSGAIASELVSRGLRCIHCTVGADVNTALEQIRELRDWVGERIAIRVDAQGQWDRDGAKSFVVRSRDLDLAYLEQPLPPDDLDGLAQLRRQASTPIVIDEGLRQASDVARIAAREAADAVVIKPTAIGGWRPASQAARLAHDMDIGILTASFLDGSIGRAFASHIAAALGCSDRPQLLATGPLLAQDLTDAPLRAQQGMLSLSDDPGLGIGTLLPELAANDDA